MRMRVQICAAADEAAENWYFLTSMQKKPVLHESSKNLILYRF